MVWGSMRPALPWPARNHTALVFWEIPNWYGMSQGQYNARVIIWKQYRYYGQCDFQLRMHQTLFVRQALTGPAGEFISLQCPIAGSGEGPSWQRAQREEEEKKRKEGKTEDCIRARHFSPLPALLVSVCYINIGKL